MAAGVSRTAPRTVKARRASVACGLRGGRRPRPPVDLQPLLRGVAGVLVLHDALAVDQDERRGPADAVAPEGAPRLVDRDVGGERVRPLLEEWVELGRGLV